MYVKKSPVMRDYAVLMLVFLSVSWCPLHVMEEFKKEKVVSHGLLPESAIHNPALFNEEWETRYWLVFGANEVEKKWDEYFNEKSNNEQINCVWIDGSVGGGQFGLGKTSEGNNIKNSDEASQPEETLSFDFNSASNIAEQFKDYEQQLEAIIFNDRTVKYALWKHEHIDAFKKLLRVGGTLYIPDDEGACFVFIRGEKIDVTSCGDLREKILTKEQIQLIDDMGQGYEAAQDLLLTTPYEFADLFTRAACEESQKGYVLLGKCAISKLQLMASDIDLVAPFAKDFELDDVNLLIKKEISASKIVAKLFDSNQMAKKPIKILLKKVDLIRVALNIKLLKTSFSDVGYVDKKERQQNPDLYPGSSKIISVKDWVKSYYKCTK